MKKLSPLALARKAGQLAFDKKGIDVRILKMKSLSSICDYYVIVSGDADVHVKAIAGAIDDGLTAMGYRPSHREGIREGNWVLLDYIDVVVHVFYAATREFYALEKLWGDAPVEILTDKKAK